MTPFGAIILGLYLLTLGLLAVLGLHRYAIVYLYFRHRHARPEPTPGPDPLPLVTVQLPIFNEMYVVERLIASACAISYPRQLLEIQVLDDSTDETASLALAAVAQYREQGFDIHYLSRADRRGFKAGALSAGLARATGEFIVIFDADFIAPPDILEKTLGHFRDPRVGMVQARWGHVNRDYSLFTEAQAILLDGHFILEHGARHRAGRFFNFNGTAGIWRREAIVSAGGWQHDTLTEDLDLSYRAQMAGWRFIFLPEVVAPAELPVQMNAFKGQQHRWAKGAIQTGRKLLPSLLASDLPTPVKLEAVFHLAANLSYPLLVLLTLLMFPALIVRVDHGLTGMILWDVPFLLGATLSVCSFYLVSQREALPEGWPARLKYLPAVFMLGIGLSVNNARAVCEALLGKPSEFVRTPKHGVTEAGENWTRRRYRGAPSLVPLAELFLAAYCGVTALYALQNALFGALPFILLFAAGFVYTAALSLFQDGGPLAFVRKAGGVWERPWTSATRAS